jgi:hypothetical protein
MDTTTFWQWVGVLVGVIVGCSTLYLIIRFAVLHAIRDARVEFARDDAGVHEPRASRE